jgi:hypothetical protein
MSTDFQKQVRGLAAQQNAPERPALRPEPREEDPRARAAKRAAELRGHLGDVDEGTDRFYIDPSSIPPGWSYEWKRRTIYNMEDPTYQVHIMRMGWEPVPASRHPEMMPKDANFKTIERDGLVLMERPLEITEEARLAELRRARAQVRAKEDQLSSAPQGQFDRSNKDTSLVKLKKSYSAVEVPQE